MLERRQRLHARKVNNSQLPQVDERGDLLERLIGEASDSQTCEIAKACEGCECPKLAMPNGQALNLKWLDNGWHLPFGAAQELNVHGGEAG
jgi:hypothetical protein